MSTSAGTLIEWPKDLPAPAANASEEVSGEIESGSEAPESAEPVKEPTEAEIRSSLAEHHGNIVRAAKALGLSSRYVLYRLMRKYGIADDQRKV